MQDIDDKYFKTVSIALDKIADEFFDVESKMIYHYTSPTGLKGIFENNSLWFTKSDYLNDLTETNYIIDALERILKKEKYGLDFYLYITNEFLDKFKSGKVEKKQNEYYICSFSKSKDELSLWNYYTKAPSKSGYNLGIMTNDLMRSVSKTDLYLNFMFGVVLYTSKEQGEILKKILDELYIVYTDIANTYGTKNTEEFDCVKNNLNDLIELLAPYFKHPAFKNERECRVVCSVRSNYDIEKIFRIREQNGIFVPYLEIPVDKDIVRTITASPYIIADNVIESIHELSNKYLYEVQANKSSIPIRKE